LENAVKLMETDSHKEQVELFMTSTQDARGLSERDQDYYDHKQWTADEVAKLTKRKQAPIVVNRIQPKVDGLLGLLSIRRTDPKAYPRTQKHEKSAEAITDALRFVSDNNHFPEVKEACAKDFFIKGYCGALVDVQRKRDEVEIRVSEIPWDRLYFDPHSRKRDFSDARFKGYMQWMEPEEAERLFGKKGAKEAAELANSAASNLTHDETFQDKPRWLNKKQNRILVAMHWYLEGGKWMFCAFTDGFYFIEPQESPYLDDDNEPCCPLELVSAHIDRENNRYGVVRGYISMQDEINHRRSKFLHLLSQRQTFGNKKSGLDVLSAKRELAKADGHVEIKDGEFGKDFGVMPTGDMAKGQVELYQDAKAELDAVGVNAQMAGDRQQGTLSGVAINRLQQAGTIELNGLFSALNGFEKRIYRQIWARIKQFWTEEKWVRVTDDVDSLRWVGLNSPVTVQKWLEQTINDKALPDIVRKQASATYMALMQNEDPMLDQQIMVDNPVPEMDVDIILDQSFDVVNVQQEQFELLAKLAVPGSGIDIIDIIQLSQLRGKEEVIERIKKSREEAAQAQGGAQQLAIQAAEQKTRETASKASVNEQTAVQKNIENQILMTSPQDMRPQVIV